MGVVALSAPADRGDLQRGLEAVRTLGFEPVEAANLESRAGLFAGGDSQRLEELHRLAADPSLKAIFFARGGHGILRLLEAIDWELLARHPRAWIGYSDATALLNQLVERLGLVAFHGPMVAVELAREPAGEERESLLRALAGEFPSRLELEWAEGVEVVEAPLAGGCLSLLAATLGTGFAPSLSGRILFWEDIDEPLYRIDRMLTQLRLSGRLAGIRAMVVGRVSPADAQEAATDLRDLLSELSSDQGWPVATGCPSGHCSPNLTLPLGLTARLDPGGRTLTVGV